MLSRRAFAPAMVPLLLLLGCAKSPPPSQLPNAQAAIDRMRATTSCGNAITADAKIDQFASQGRVRGELLMLAARPDQLRMDVLVPVQGSVATLSSDGKRFALRDLRNSRFYTGPATACNLARLTGVPIPSRVLVNLLLGQATILRHDAPGLAAPTLAWSGNGYYVVTIAGTQDATEEVHLEPRPEDWGKPWAEQHLRVLDVSVTQRGVLLYHAQLDGHLAAKMSEITPADAVLGITASGPMCDAELPRRIHVEMPAIEQDVLFRYDSVAWNPPIDGTSFTQPTPTDLPLAEVTCEDR